MLELLWYELESKGGASEPRLLIPRLVFPSSDTSPPLISEPGCNSKYRVRRSPSMGLTRMVGELKYVFNAENASSHFVSH